MSVVVVGAGPGLGAAIAGRFARDGHEVALVARRVAVAEEIAERLPTRALVVAGDAADPGSLERALEAATDAVGTPDALVYNAALVQSDASPTLTPETLTEALQVGTVGAYRAARFLHGAMAARGSGSVLLTGGGLALRQSPQAASLSVAKTALRALTFVLAEPFAADGVHVATVTIAGTVAPGTALDPDAIAERYATLHAEPRGTWTTEVVVEG